MNVLRQRLPRFVIALAAGLAGCSSIDARVGARQDSCGEGESAASGGGGGTGTPYPGAREVAAAASGTCAADAGSACDDCESQWCCDARLACYRDPVCVCADEALDGCLSDAAADPSRVSACWDAFAKRGSVEAAFVACDRMSCAEACGVR